MSVAADPIIALSRERIERGSKSFAAAARLFPPELRESAYMLYAWCRHCDDVIDGQEMGFASPDAGIVPRGTRSDIELVDLLRRQTLAATRGTPDGPIFEALARVVDKHDIPERHPLELIDGFAMDASGRRYQSLEETILYSYHVAGVVGLMMARVMGVRDAPTLRRASDLGIAFQLTNIARDVMDDAAIGRVYLPLDWLADAGIPASDIDDPAHRAAVAAVAMKLLAEADRYYASATYGIAALPFRPAMAIAAARSVYRAIGTKVRSRGAEAWDRRAVISKPFKVATLLTAPLAVLQARAVGAMGPTPRQGLWTHPALADETGDVH